MEFIYSTYLLEQAEAAGTLVVNKPQSIRDCNEKCLPPCSHSVRLRSWWPAVQDT